MASITLSDQVAEMAKCSRPSQADVIFVAMDALLERIHVEDLIAIRNVTAMSYPCVFDLTVCFSESFCFMASSLASSFAIDLPHE